MNFLCTVVIFLSTFNQEAYAGQRLREKALNDKFKAMVMELEETTSKLEDRYGVDISNNGAETCSDEKPCWDTTKKECIEGICQCKEGWISDGGNGCQDLDECQLTGDSYPCDREGGYCIDRAPDDGRFLCLCLEGYDGSKNYGHGPERCSAKRTKTLRIAPPTSTTAPSIVPAPTINPSTISKLIFPECPLSEIDFQILTKKGLIADNLDGEGTQKPSFEFILPKASQRLLIFFDFIEKGSWDGVGINGDQNDYVGLKLESPTRNSIGINFGGFHHGVSETMREGDEDGFHWSVTSSNFGIDSKRQTHHVAVEVQPTNLSYNSELLMLIIDYNLSGKNDEWLDIENLQIFACMDTVPSVTPSGFPTSIPSAAPTTPLPGTPISIASSLFLPLKDPYIVRTKTVLDKIANDPGAAWLNMIFRNVNREVEVRTWNGGWVSNIYLPDGTYISSGSKFQIKVRSQYSVTIHNNGESISVSNGEDLMFVVVNNVWITG